MSRIFIVEDDIGIREMYEMALEDEFETVCFERAETMLEYIKDNHCDLILLDLMLPGMDGLQAMKIIKENDETKHIPVIIASAKGEEMNKVIGLDSGADDYLAKPFGMKELIARIKVHIRKNAVDKPADIITIGDITVNDEAHTVVVGGNDVVLTLKEYNLLKLLMQNEDKVIDRIEILKKVWNYDYVGETRTLDMHVKSLRSKISKFTDKQYINTVRGIGYKFSSKEN